MILSMSKAPEGTTVIKLKPGEVVRLQSDAPTKPSIKLCVSIELATVLCRSI